MKSFMTRLLLISTFAATAFMGGCANYTTVREHKDLSQIAPSIRSVAILPPDVKIQKINFTGENENLADKENAMNASLTSLLKNKIDWRYSKNLVVKDFDFPKEIANSSDFAYAITQCKKAFAESEKSLYAKPVEKKNRGSFSESIGSLGNNIGDTVGVDALVILQYNGFVKSGGMVAKDVAAGILIGVLTGSVAVSPTEGSSISVGIIDANSGDVLWTNHAAAPKLDTSPLDMALKDLPSTKWGEAPAAASTSAADGSNITAAAASTNLPESTTANP